MSREIVVCTDKIIGWNDALDEARRLYWEAEARVRCLRNSIKLIEKKIADDEPWPMEKGVG